MNTLFALFPCRWEQMPESSGLEVRLGKKWTMLLEPFPQLEKAIFMESILKDEPDAYTPSWRRFIRVGSSLPEQVANLFELCFEKNYEQVIFCETLCAALSPEQLENFIQASREKEMVLLPAEDGSVLMASMQVQHLEEWNFFRFHAQGAVVEMISECHELNISYSILEGINCLQAAGYLKAELEKFRPSA